MSNFVEIVDEAESFPVQIGDSTFTLRRLDTAAVEQIASAHRKRRRDQQGRWYHEIPQEAMLGYLADLYDYIILDWTGVIHPMTKAAVPCDREHKLKLPTKVKDRLVELADAENLTTTTDPTRRSGGPSNGS